MKFFVLKQSHDHYALTNAFVVTTDMGDARTCPVCGIFVSALTWLPPYQAELELIGREYADIIFHAGNGLLLSQQAADLYRKHGLTGFTTLHPVEVTKLTSRRRRRPEPPAYFYAPLFDGPARIDPIASEMEWTDPPTCNHCLSGMITRWKRVALESDSWTGQDIFHPIGLRGTVVVSERFQEMCLRHELLNADLIPAEEYAYDFYPGGKDIHQSDQENPDDWPDTTHPLIHYLYLPTRQAAKQMQIALSAQDIETCGPFKSNRRWEVQAYTITQLDPSTIATLERFFIALAKEHRAEYQDWIMDRRTEAQKAADQRRQDA